MFGFLNMMGDYESRKVGRFDEGELSVSTAAVTDSDKPYETAVMHPDYYSGKWVIVEMYDSREAAEAGHGKWVKTMTADPLPSTLVDVSSAETASLCDIVGGEGWRNKARAT